MKYLIMIKKTLEILESYKQLNKNNDNFTINEMNKIWINIEKNNIKYLMTNENKRISESC